MARQYHEIKGLSGGSFFMSNFRTHFGNSEVGSDNSSGENDNTSKMNAL